MKLTATAILMLFVFTGNSQIRFNKVDFNKPLATNCLFITKPLFPSPTLSSIHYELPKGAIFCRMEDALHQHFNLWIKFRMGNDDRYSN